MDERPLALESKKKEDEASPPCSPARTALNSFFDRLGDQIAKARQSDGSTEEAPLASSDIIQPLLATASIDSQMQQHQIITRAVTATTTPSSPPTTDETASPAETAQSEKKAEKVVSTANGEEVLAFVILKNFVFSIADVFGKTMSDAADLLLKFAATTEAAIPQVMEMLEALKTQEKEEKREEVVEAPTLVETLSTWWSPPVQKEPEGVMERLALWWSPPPQEEPQGLLERVGMWWCPPPPPKEPEGLFERLLSWWCPPPRKEIEAPSLCSAIAKYFSSL